MMTLLNSSTKGQILLDSTYLDTQTVIAGLNVPWEIYWGPDDQIWMTERWGRVSRVDPVAGTQVELLDLSSEVYATGEAGLLGLITYPNFDDSAYVFLVYTYVDGPIKEKIVRYKYSADTLINPVILVDNIPAASTHDGSRLLFLADNTLLMTTGDAQNQSDAQDTTILSGKILRMDFNGNPPADNPISGSLVYTWGHRNPQGLCHGPFDMVYSSEHGPSTDDEVNIITPDSNYGWPEVHGYCDDPGENIFCASTHVKEPIQAFTPTIATSDIIYYNSDAIPEWKNSILLTALKDKRIYELKMNSSGETVLVVNEYFENYWGRLRDICMAPDGRIFIATNGADWGNIDPWTHKIIEIKPQGLPPLTTQPIKKNNWTIVSRQSSLKITPKYALQDYSVALYTLAGEKLMDKPVRGVFNIESSVLSDGLYIVRVSNEKQSLQEKWLVIH